MIVASGTRLEPYEVTAEVGRDEKSATSG